MAEGEKAIAEAKTNFDNPLAEPESAPQIAAEPAAETTAAETPAEPTRRKRRWSPRQRLPRLQPETASSETVPAVSETPQIEEKPAKAAAE